MRHVRRIAMTVPVLAVALSSCVSRAPAQLTVFDPGNYSQNLLSATRALEQINNQVRQLQAQAQMLMRMDQNLVRLAGSISPDLQRTLTAIQSQLQQGNGIAVSLQVTQSTYERLFPREVSADLSNDAVLCNAHARWQEQYDSLRRATLLQGQIGDAVASDTHLLGQAIDRSRLANGALEVAQAGNELTGLNVKQALTLQSLLAAQHRADTLARARDVAGEQEARQRFKTFLGTGAAYTASR